MNIKDIDSDCTFCSQENTIISSNSIQPANIKSNNANLKLIETIQNKIWLHLNKKQFFRKKSIHYYLNRMSLIKTTDPKLKTAIGKYTKQLKSIDKEIFDYEKVVRSNVNRLSVDVSQDIWSLRSIHAPASAQNNKNVHKNGNVNSKKPFYNPMSANNQPLLDDIRLQCNTNDIFCSMSLNKPENLINLNSQVYENYPIADYCQNDSISNITPSLLSNNNFVYSDPVVKQSQVLLSLNDIENMRNVENKFPHGSKAHFVNCNLQSVTDSGISSRDNCSGHYQQPSKKRKLVDIETVCNVIDVQNLNSNVEYTETLPGENDESFARDGKFFPFDIFINAEIYLTELDNIIDTFKNFAIRRIDEQTAENKKEHSHRNLRGNPMKVNAFFFEPTIPLPRDDETKQINKPRSVAKLEDLSLLYDHIMYEFISK